MTCHTHVISVAQFNTVSQNDPHRHDLLCILADAQRHCYLKRGTFFSAKFVPCLSDAQYHHWLCSISVGWSYSSPPPRDINASFHQPYDPNGYGVGLGRMGMKAKIIDLIRAVRALRSMSSCHLIFLELNLFYSTFDCIEYSGHSLWTSTGLISLFTAFSFAFWPYLDLDSVRPSCCSAFISEFG